jgi:hypothetical protein
MALGRRFIARLIPLLRDFVREKCRKRVYDPMPVLHDLLPVSFPFCDLLSKKEKKPTTFLPVKDSDLLSLKEQKTLDVSLQHFTQFIARFIPLLRSFTVLRWCVDCKQSAAQERKKREKTLAAILYGFMPFYIP